MVEKPDFQAIQAYVLTNVYILQEVTYEEITFFDHHFVFMFCNHQHLMRGTKSQAGVKADK